MRLIKILMIRIKILMTKKTVLKRRKGPNNLLSTGTALLVVQMMKRLQEPSKIQGFVTLENYISQISKAVSTLNSVGKYCHTDWPSGNINFCHHFWLPLNLEKRSCWFMKFLHG